MRTRIFLTALTMLVLASTVATTQGLQPRSPAGGRAVASELQPGPEIGQMPGFPKVLPTPENPVTTQDNVRGVVLADLDGKADGTGKHTLEVIYTSQLCTGDDLPFECSAGLIWVWDASGTDLPGFPLRTEGGALAAPSIGDLDGDGDQEIVQITVGPGCLAKLYVVDHHGSVLPGFPIDTGWAGINDSAALYDLDHDGALEIIYSTAWDLHVFEHDGSEWRDGMPASLEDGGSGTPAVGDVDGDGTAEIFIAGLLGRLYLIGIDGAPLEGWPVQAPEGCTFEFWASGALADLDGDLDLEVIAVARHGFRRTFDKAMVLAYHHDGTPVRGWPQELETMESYCTPLVTDLEGDGEMEVVLGDGNEGDFADEFYSLIYAWDAEGNPKPGFPFRSQEMGAEIWQVTAADYDGDGRIELFSDALKMDLSVWLGYIFGIDASGKLLPGFPLRPEGSSFFNGATLGDVDGDGDYELASVGMDHEGAGVLVNLFDLPGKAKPADGDWLTYHARNERGGLQKRHYRGWRFVYSGGRVGRK